MSGPADDDPRFAPPPEAGAEDPSDLELATRVVPARASDATANATATATATAPPAATATSTATAAATAAAHAAPRLARGALALLLTPPAVLLPARWRVRLGLDALPLRHGAILVGFLQIVFAIAAFLWLIQDVHARLVAPHSSELTQYIADSESPHAVGALRATGMALWIYVLLSWKGLGCVYLLGEAMVRLAAVPVSGEIIPSGPLALIDRAHAAGSRYLAARRLPPLVDDEVSRSAGGTWLEIASCRVRDWPLGTVLIVDAFAWRVAGVVERTGTPRPFVYRLEPAPAGQVVRGRPVYRTDALTRPAPR